MAWLHPFPVFEGGEPTSLEELLRFCGCCATWEDERGSLPSWGQCAIAAGAREFTFPPECSRQFRAVEDYCRGVLGGEGTPSQPGGGSRGAGGSRGGGGRRGAGESRGVANEGGRRGGDVGAGSGLAAGEDGDGDDSWGSRDEDDRWRPWGAGASIRDIIAWKNAHYTDDGSDPESE